MPAPDQPHGRVPADPRGGARDQDAPACPHAYDAVMTEPRWKQRYRAPSLTLPRWAPDDPEHLVYVSNLSGSWQVHAWDRAADRHRQVSDHPTGVVAGGLTPDGTRVVWFEDSKGGGGGSPSAPRGGARSGWPAGTASRSGSARSAGPARSCTATPRWSTSAGSAATAACWPSTTPSTATTSTRPCGPSTWRACARPPTCGTGRASACSGPRPGVRRGPGAGARAG